MKTINIENFNGIKVEIAYKEIMDRYAEKARGKLQTISPKSHRPGRATPYSLGWEVRKEYISKGYKDVVWNRTNWQLTHLLENGHFITNQGALSWSQPQKHIRPTFDSIRDPYVRAIRKAKIKAEFM